MTGQALLVVALSGRSLRGRCSAGLVFGGAFFFPLLSWTLNVAWYAWLALALADTGHLRGARHRPATVLRLPGWPFAVAGWWVAAEALRTAGPSAASLGRLAMSQATAPTGAGPRSAARRC